ncbi:IS3 family transposase [Paenibacillus sp. 8b26]
MHQPEATRGKVQRYIHFYNHHRFQKKLNNLSPVGNRTKAA